MKSPARYVLLALMAGLGACATARPSDVAAGQNKGKALYEDRCGRCHDAIPAHAYPPTQWPSIVRRMGSEARLTAREADRILVWLQEGR